MYLTTMPTPCQGSILKEGGLVYFEWTSSRLEVSKVLKAIEKQAQALQCNAVVGLQIQVIAKDSELMVFAYGTAVQLDSTVDQIDSSEVPIKKWFK